jgi:hypothetical protein
MEAIRFALSQEDLQKVGVCMQQHNQPKSSDNLF